MFFLITLVTDFNLMFLLSQSERLQDRCQPGAAGNRSDQHHGLLCVSLPCHRQLWEVCVSVCVIFIVIITVMFILKCFLSHPGQL